MEGRLGIFFFCYMVGFCSVRKVVALLHVRKICVRIWMVVWEIWVLGQLAGSGMIWGAESGDQEVGMWFY